MNDHFNYGSTLNNHHGNTFILNQPIQSAEERKLKEQ